MAYLATVVSAFAYILFVILVSVFPLNSVKSSALNLDIRQIAATVLLAAVFLFVPAGSLPAFICVEYSALIIALLCVTAVIVSGQEKTAKSAKLFCLLFSAFSFLFLTLNFALLEGFPGYEFSFGILGSVNIWRYMNFPGIICAVLTVCSFCGLAFCCCRTFNGIFSHVFVTACVALTISIVLPFGFGKFCGLFGLPLYIADFALFWTVVCCLKNAILKFSAKQ